MPQIREQDMLAARALIRQRLPGRADRSQRARVDLAIRMAWAWQETGTFDMAVGDVKVACVLADVEALLRGETPEGAEVPDADS